MGILILFFILLCIALPLGEFARATITLNVSFTLIDILVVSASLVYFLTKIFQRKMPSSLQAKLFILVNTVLFFSLLVTLTMRTVSQTLIASLYLVRWISLGTLFFIVKDSSVWMRKKISYLLFAGGTLLLLGGFLQYFFYPSLRNLIYFGWDEHFYRMFGTFFDPNFFGLFLVLFLLFVLGKLFTISAQKQKYSFVFLFLIACATYIGILLTYSRTALVALLAGIIVLMWQKAFWRWIWWSLGAIMLAALFVFFLSTRRTDVNSLFRTTSADARIGSAKNALVIFLDNPLLGVGFNAYRYAQYRHHFMVGSPIQEDHGASGADSSVLLVLATSGIVGEVVFLLFLAIHAKELAKKKEKTGLATFTALFIGSFFVNGLFYPMLLVWFWTIAGISESSSKV